MLQQELHTTTTEKQASPQTPNLESVSAQLLSTRIQLSNLLVQWQRLEPEQLKSSFNRGTLVTFYLETLDLQREAERLLEVLVLADF